MVKPHKKFDYFFPHGRAIDNDDQCRLRALACYLFLSGSHIDIMESHDYFLDHLFEAIDQWHSGFAADSLGKSSASGKGETPNEEESKVIAATTAITPAPIATSPDAELLTTSMAYEETLDISADTHICAARKHKLGDAVRSLDPRNPPRHQR